MLALSVSISWVDALMVERARATQAGHLGLCSGRRVIQGDTHPLGGSWSRRGGAHRYEGARAQALLRFRRSESGLPAGKVHRSALISAAGCRNRHLETDFGVFVARCVGHQN